MLDCGGPVPICHHHISVLLNGGPHDACHSFRHLLPLRFLDHKLFFPCWGKAVILELPVTIRGGLPFRGDPTSFLQAMQCGIERTMLHLQEIVCGPLNVLSDLVAMGGTIKQGSEDEHVQRALEQIRALLCLFCHRRRSTLGEE
jgi:hypothetical protein